MYISYFPPEGIFTFFPTIRTSLVSPDLSSTVAYSFSMTFEDSTFFRKLSGIEDVFIRVEAIS